MVVAAPSGRPVFARVAKKLVGGKLAFDFKAKGHGLPGRLRLTIGGLGSNAIALTAKLSRS